MLWNNLCRPPRRTTLYISTNTSAWRTTNSNVANQAISPLSGWFHYQLQFHASIRIEKSDNCLSSEAGWAGLEERWDDCDNDSWFKWYVEEEPINVRGGWIFRCKKSIRSKDKRISVSDWALIGLYIYGWLIELRPCRGVLYQEGPHP